MEEVTYNTMLIVNLVAVGLIFTVLWKLKKPKSRLMNLILPALISVIIDVTCIANGLVSAPICLPSLEIVFLGIDLRSQGWPSTHKLAIFYRYYIIFLTFCLMPSFALLSRIRIGYGSPLDYILMFIVLIISLFVFSFSNPIRISQQREFEKLKGVGLGFLGFILSLLFLSLYDSFRIIVEGLVIFLAPINLVSAILLSLPFFLCKNQT